MRLIANSGGDRVVDELRRCLAPLGSLDIATAVFSLFALAEVQEPLTKLAKCRLVIPAGEATGLTLLGGPSDRAYRNRLVGRWLAKQCAAWLEAEVDVKNAPAGLPQATLIAGNADGSPIRVITGNCPFTTEGLGITPGKPVHSVGAGVLLVCLAPQIATAEVEPLALGMVAWHKEQAPTGESTVVFRDSAFADDVAKTNLTAILQQHGLENVRSL